MHCFYQVSRCYWQRVTWSIYYYVVRFRSPWFFLSQTREDGKNESEVWEKACQKESVSESESERKRKRATKKRRREIYNERNEAGENAYRNIKMSKIETMIREKLRKIWCLTRYENTWSPLSMIVIWCCTNTTAAPKQCGSWNI